MLDVAALPIEAHVGNQSVFFSADVEDMQISHFVDRSECSSKVLKRAEVPVLDQFEPLAKWACGVGMSLAEGFQCLPGYDVHRLKI